MKIAIATPCQDHVTAGYAYDLARLMAWTAMARPDLELSYHQNRGTIIPQQRHTLVLSAREAKASHLLFVDSDMRFPPSALADLLAHQQPIVAVNYATRRAPILPTAEHREHGYLFTPDTATGLAEVTHCGMGLMLIEMGVFERIPKPWFAIGYNPKDAEYSGEDFFFCKKARDAEFAVLVDQDLSRQIRHEGSMDYTHAHTEVTRDLYAEQAASNGA